MTDDQHFPVLVGRRWRDWDRSREEHAWLRADHGPVLRNEKKGTMYDVRNERLIFALFDCLNGFWADWAVDSRLGRALRRGMNKGLSDHMTEKIYKK